MKKVKIKVINQKKSDYDLFINSRRIEFHSSRKQLLFVNQINKQVTEILHQFNELLIDTYVIYRENYFVMSYSDTKLIRQRLNDAELYIHNCLYRTEYTNGLTNSINFLELIKNTFPDAIETFMLYAKKNSNTALIYKCRNWSKYLDYLSTRVENIVDYSLKQIN